jgi:deoxycytidine triphosphate deaminase
MRLSDKEIHKYLKSGEFVAVGTNPKYPFDSVKQVQPCSIDLRLDNKFFKFRINKSTSGVN